MYKRDYLTENERNDMVLLGYLMGVLEKIYKSGMQLDSNMKRYLKTAHTYMGKFYELKVNTISPQEAKKVHDKLIKADIAIFDDSTRKRLQGEFEDAFKLVHMTREQFNIWCNEIMYQNCNGCTKHFAECELHQVFEDNFIPESSWGLENCRYAYKLSKK